MTIKEQKRTILMVQMIIEEYLMRMVSDMEARNLTEIEICRLLSSEPLYLAVKELKRLESNLVADFREFRGRKVL